MKLSKFEISNFEAWKLEKMEIRKDEKSKTAPDKDEDRLSKIFKNLEMNFMSIKNTKRQFAIFICM